MCPCAIDFASASMRTLSVSRNVSGRLRSSWWPRTCTSRGSTGNDFQMSTNVDMRSTCLSFYFTFSVFASTCFSASIPLHAVISGGAPGRILDLRHVKPIAFPTSPPISLR